MVAPQVETCQGKKGNSVMEVTRTFDLLDRYATKFADKTDVFAAKVNRRWVSIM